MQEERGEVARIFQDQDLVIARSGDRVVVTCSSTIDADILMSWLTSVTGQEDWLQDVIKVVPLGTRGKFFHPMTMGVMHSGVVRANRVKGGEHQVRVHFSIDNKSYWTVPEYNSE